MVVVAAIGFAATGAISAYGQGGADSEPVIVDVFTDASVHFLPDDPGRYATSDIQAADNGRAVVRRVRLPAFTDPVRIIAHLTLKPIPKDEQTVWDKWDRAGGVRLEMENGPPIEIMKFITAYGGRTQHDVDVTELAPLLKGDCLISAFIDTWVTPAWKLDFSLEYIPSPETVNPIWGYSLMLDDSFTAEDMARGGIEVEVDIPDGLKRVMLEYYVSGHCTDGRDADEFISKDNVIRVDDFVVYRYRPWRNDCDELRAVNPYCRRWSDGYWSSDYSRSGWCPGDVVTPLALDLSDHLTPGRHRVRFAIEKIRPKDRDGNYGYWRISSRLIGYDQVPERPTD